VVFDYLDSSKPMAARQEEVFTHSSVVILHISESAKIFPWLARFPSLK
jgi:hypothetical protein